MRALLLTFALVLVACGGDDAPLDPDARPVDAGVTEPDASCFTNPVTHIEIINACTTAEKIYKTPTLPLRLPDGGLPPLP